MQSSDIVEGNVAKIAALFPQCVTECRDMPSACSYESDGGQTNSTCQRHVPTVRYKIDWDKLRAELEPDLIQDAEERYQFTWPDKRAASRLANQPTDKTLRPDVDASVDFWNTENLYIEGDNLDVLKVLRENYLGAIKMIYIDPPYNTGNDFVYTDEYSRSKNEYDDNEVEYDYDNDKRSVGIGIKRGAFDLEGNQLLDPMQRNTESNGRFHTDWLNMIYPRLKVARNLLTEDGVVFISIDDCEVDNLRKVCDEVFGQENFIANLIWQKKFSRANDAQYFSTMHDHILCYAKLSKYVSKNGWEIGLLPRGEEIPTGYANPDNDYRGFWTSVVLSAKSGSPSLLYPITTPSGRTVTPPSGRYWGVNQEKFNALVKDNRIWFGKDGDGTPRLKTFLSEVQQGLRPNTIIFHSEGGHNQEGKQETKALFDGAGVFDGPKPVRLLSHLLKIANLNSNSIILDFFSGSATTAHAVMKLNAEDGGKRKFIMVQLPEVTDEKSEARKAGYKTICQIGEERIRRAGKKIKEEICRDMPLACSKAKAMVSNETSRSDVPTLDIGFRVLKLDSSNMKDVYYTPDEFDKESLFDVDNVKPGRSALDLLFQVMPELNIELSAKIEMKEVNSKKVYFVNGNYLIATFDKDVNESTVTEIARMRPVYFVMRDASAANDNVLDNFEQIFRHFSPDTICKIL